MTAANVSGQVCLNHPDRSATSRCETCFKPLCDECIQVEDGKHFCSDTCARNYRATAARIDGIAARDRARRRKKMLRRLVLLVVIVTAAVFAYRWWKSNPETAQDLRRQLERKAEDVKKQVP